MKSKKICLFYTVLTNGHDEIEVECNRYNCYVTIPDGSTFEVVNGEYYLNGEKAWLETRMVGQ